MVYSHVGSMFYYDYKWKTNYDFVIFGYEL